MKKLITLLLALVATVSMNAQTIYQWDETRVSDRTPDEKGYHHINYEDGATLSLTVDPTKGFAKGVKVSIDGTTYRAIKLSNGKQNTFSAPEGKKIYSVTLYSYINWDVEMDGLGADEADNYWQEINGVKYTKNTAPLMNYYYCSKSTPKSFKTLTKDADGYDVVEDGGSLNEITFSFPDGVDNFTFTNKGHQLGFVISVSYATPSQIIQIPDGFSAFATSVQGLDFTGNTDINAYIAYSNADKTQAILEQIYKVPPYTGVILENVSHNEAGSSVALLTGLGDVVTNNKLVCAKADGVALTGAEVLENEGYYLTFDADESTVFCKFSGEATYQVALNKCYLSTKSSTNTGEVDDDDDPDNVAPARVANATPARATASEPTKKYIKMVESVSTGIAPVTATEARTADTAIYTLGGQRVARASQHGIYIIGGKKVIK